MKPEILQQLIDSGYADEAGLAATVTAADGKTYALCANGDIVTLAIGDPPQKVFSDSVDRLKNVRVKSGLFKKTLAFTHDGTDYAFTVRDGKTMLEYFGQLAE